MANAYTIRVHEINDTIRERLVRQLERTGGSFLLVRETQANRAHYQGWVRTDLTQQTFRVRIKNALPECVGNRAYSIGAVRDLEAYFAYMMKGTREEVPDVVAYWGIDLSEEIIRDKHRAYWSLHDKPTKDNTKSVMSELREWASLQELPTRAELARKACDIMVGRHKVLNLFYVRALVNSVAYQTNHDERENIIDEIVNKR